MGNTIFNLALLCSEFQYNIKLFKAAYTLIYIYVGTSFVYYQNPKKKNILLCIECRNTQIRVIYSGIHESRTKTYPEKTPSDKTPP